MESARKAPTGLSLCPMCRMHVPTHNELPWSPRGEMRVEGARKLRDVRSLTLRDRLEPGVRSIRSFLGGQMNLTAELSPAVAAQNHI